MCTLVGPACLSANLLTVCCGDKVHVHTLETQLARTTEELKGLKVRQQELETKLSQAQW